MTRSKATPAKQPEGLAGVADTRERILRVAIELFHAQGYGATGLREVADLANVNVASIYHHFRSKEEILVAIVEETCRANYEPAARLVERASSPSVALVGLTRHHISFHCNRAPEAAITDRELGSLRMPARRRILELRDNYEQLWEHVLRGGVEAGSFTVADIPLVRMACLAVCSQVATWYREGGRLSVEEISNLHAQLLLRMVGYRSTAAAQPDVQGGAEPNDAAGAEARN